MYKSNFVTAIIAAAGMGSRMNMSVNKQFLSINGMPVLAHTLQKIQSCNYVDFIVIIVKKDEEDYVHNIVEKYNIIKPCKLVEGGKERQDSIYNGLLNLPIETDIVLTHDGARPFVTLEKIEKSIEAVFETGASVLANPVKDTIKVSTDGKLVEFTPKRDVLWAIQTPQVFKKDIILKAYKQAYDENYYGTDDCSLVEKTGNKVKLVLSDYNNIKITTPEDLIIAEAISKNYENSEGNYYYFQEELLWE